MQKVIQIWQHKTGKQQIRILNVVNKIVAAEMLPTKQPVFLTTIDLENYFEMIDSQVTIEDKSKTNH